MFTGKTVLALALSALLPASAAWAANKDTIIYCSEASPESFNPQIASSGPSFVASSQTLYNRLINLIAIIAGMFEYPWLLDYRGPFRQTAKHTRLPCVKG